MPAMATANLNVCFEWIFKKLIEVNREYDLSIATPPFLVCTSLSFDKHPGALGGRADPEMS